MRIFTDARERKHKNILVGQGDNGEPVVQCLDCPLWARGPDADVRLETRDCIPDESTADDESTGEEVL